VFGLSNSSKNKEIKMQLLKNAKIYRNLNVESRVSRHKLAGKRMGRE